MHLELLGTEQTLTTATNFGRAKLVRILNDGAGAALITVAKSGGQTEGTVTIQAGAVETIEKDPLDLISSSAAVKAVSVSF